MKENFIILCEWLLEKCKNRSKKFYATILLLVVMLFGSIGYFTPKVPNSVGCWWTAYNKYELPPERWRFNWLLSNEDPDQCQRRNHKGDWMPMDNVSDSGSSDDEE